MVMLRSPLILALGLFVSHSTLLASTHHLDVIGGVFYGPGNIPDSPLAVGRLSNLELETPLTGVIPFFNNGSAVPNLAGEKQLMGRSEGRLSDGRLYNENTDDGVTSIGNGILDFFITVAADGPNKGQGVYTLQNNLNLEIRTDLALDPGFKEGLVVSENLRITTGLLWTPFSLQYQQGMQGGVEQAGSLPSGAPVLGKLGDYDGDGLLEGDIIGVSNVPLGHVFSPGLPVVQVRKFRSDIPMQPEDSATFILASVHNIADIWQKLKAGEIKENARAYVFEHLSEYLGEALRRIVTSEQLLDKYLQADTKPENSSEIQRLQAELNSILMRADTLKQLVEGIKNQAILNKADVKPVDDLFVLAAHLSEEMRALLAINRKYHL